VLQLEIDKTTMKGNHQNNKLSLNFKGVQLDFHVSENAKIQETTQDVNNSPERAKIVSFKD